MRKRTEKELRAEIEKALETYFQGGVIFECGADVSDNKKLLKKLFSEYKSRISPKVQFGIEGSSVKIIVSHGLNDTRQMHKSIFKKIQEATCFGRYRGKVVRLFSDRDGG